MVPKTVSRLVVNSYETSRISEGLTSTHNPVMAAGTDWLARALYGTSIATQTPDVASTTCFYPAVNAA